MGRWRPKDAESRLSSQCRVRIDLQTGLHFRSHFFSIFDLKWGYSCGDFPHSTDLTVETAICSLTRCINLCETDPTPRHQCALRTIHYHSWRIEVAEVAIRKIRSNLLAEFPSRWSNSSWSSKYHPQGIILKVSVRIHSAPSFGSFEVMPITSRIRCWTIQPVHPAADICNPLDTIQWTHRITNSMQWIPFSR